MLSIVRPALIVGTGMKGTLRSMVNGIYRGYYHHIKENNARRSVIHATDVSAAVNKIASIGGVFNLTDGVNPTVYDLAEALAYRMGDKRIYTMSMGFAKFIANEQVQLIDSRTPEEFNSGHIPGAVNINIDDENFRAKVNELDKSRPIAVYCRGGRRSKEAADIMAGCGYDVTELSEGIISWKGEIEQ